MVGGSDGEKLPTLQETWVQSLLGRSSGEGNGYQLHLPCLENPIVRGVWCARVHRVANSQTRLSN